MYKHLLTAALIVVVSSSQAQVRVVESSPQSARSGVGQPPLNAAGIGTDALADIQALKYELATLRGMVEEQAHEITRLKQQQTENYLNLDKRISAFSDVSNITRPAAAAAATSTSITTSPTATPVRTSIPATVTSGSVNDAEVYTAAYDLLRKRQYDAAIMAFNDYLSRFPRGAYAGNSYYWLGEVYLLQEDYAQARDWFSKLLTEFPNDRKVLDTKYKLGRVYHSLGDNGQARTLLEEVARGTGDAARLAKQYLQDNF